MVEKNTDAGKEMKKLLAALFLLFLSAPAVAADAPGGLSFPVKYGDAAASMAVDMDNFGASLRQNFKPSGQLIADFIPIEARVGRFFMSALSDVARALYAAFIPFLNMLIIALFAFWIFMESWQMIKTAGDYWDLAMRIVKRAVVIVIWMWILNNDPAELFMWLMAPVISLGSGMSELILSGTTKIIGTNLPDYCQAIHAWMAGENSLMIGSQYAADLLCMPTRVAGFFYTAVATGFEWMKQGLGRNGLTFMMGLIFVLLFIYNIWKFALAALGVVADLFFVLLFLPFTAVNESFKGGKDTKYDGIFKPVWDALINFVDGKNISLDSQFKKFINAVIYFIVLSVVAAICIALLAGVNPMHGGDFISILIIGCLVAYLMGKVDDLAKGLTGAGEKEVFGDVGDDVGNLVKSIGQQVASWGKNATKIIAGGSAKTAPAPAAPTPPTAPAP